MSRVAVSLRSLAAAVWSGEGRGLGARVFSLLTAPVAALYGLGVWMRNAAYDRHWFRRHRSAIPVVCVGNLTVGGTGKTPVSAWVLRTLQEMGRRPALVARGYGEDELLLHRRWNPDCPVIREPDRVKGVAAAAALGCDVAVLDDGFQHRRLERDLDIVLVSPSQPLPGRLFPRGPYREPLGGARRAHLLLVPERPGVAAEAVARTVEVLRSRRGFPPAYPFHVALAGWAELTGASAPPPSGPLLLVSSVADPEGFAASVAMAVTGEAERVVYPDHHPYSAKDAAEILRRAHGRTIVTTEKDAVKLSAFPDLRSRTRVLVLEAHPEAVTAVALRGALREALGERGEGP